MLRQQEDNEMLHLQEEDKHLMQYLVEQQDASVSEQEGNPQTEDTAPTEHTWARASNTAQPQGEEHMQQHNARYGTPNDADNEAMEELNELAELQ
ncbi:hypothetical protein CYMTET_16908 [Cymbomonas tetramitiformis]|uniref:Uncharacterized protein n=1 Tax=Cymbomonas tetramitiformis TaxID=36881 RepID=A0AAE0L7N9_9CHLO|nr:hypothetical protein CYMTET_16908 [Cymbomonas tetramitiformis]